MKRRVAGVLLAGGRSRRMGSEKPLVEVGGRPLVERVAGVVSACVDEILLVTNSPGLYEFLGLRLVPDTFPGRGPLAGIHAGLSRLAEGVALVVACDYPLLEVEALRRIAREDPDGGVVVPRIEGRMQPLCALYDAALAPLAEAALVNGELMVATFLDRIPRRVLQAEDLGGEEAAARIFFNVNTPDDVRRAEEMLAKADPRG